MVGRYVVGIDESRSAQSARAWAESRAANAGLECLLVHVGHDASAVGSAARGPLSSTSDEAVTVVPGTFPDALLSQVLAGDTLVIGTGKTGFLHGRVFGSTGIQIAAGAPCTVVVIPDMDVRFRSGVVAGIDRQETAEIIAEAAATEAAALGTSLQLLHSDPARAGRRDDELDMTVAAAELMVRSRWPELDVRARSVARPAAEALLDAARNAALLVLGPGALRETVGMPGRVLHDVLINANAPIMVARQSEPDREATQA